MIIGLTGGIASGKTAVTHYLVQKGIPIVDADVVAREVVAPGTIGLSEIVKHFGHEILDQDKLNRRALREIIFNDEEKRLMLNSLLHPIIHTEILRQLDQFKILGHTLIVFDAPLLLENKLQKMVDELWVVSTSLQSQIDRVMKRDDISEDQAKLIISRQMPLEKKVKYADVVLDNNGTIDQLYDQIEVLLKDRL